MNRRETINALKELYKIKSFLTEKYSEAIYNAIFYVACSIRDKNKYSVVVKENEEIEFYRNDQLWDDQLSEYWIDCFKFIQNRMPDVDLEIRFTAEDAAQAGEGG